MTDPAVEPSRIPPTLDAIAGALDRVIARQDLDRRELVRLDTQLVRVERACTSLEGVARTLASAQLAARPPPFHPFLQAALVCGGALAGGSLAMFFVHLLGIAPLVLR